MMKLMHFIKVVIVDDNGKSGKIMVKVMKLKYGKDCRVSKVVKLSKVAKVCKISEVEEIY